MASDKSTANRTVRTADRLQVIPLDLLMPAPPPRSRRPEIETLLLYWRTARSLPGQFQTWQWCLGFTLCQSLISSILVLCWINPVGISASLTITGIIASLFLLIPAIRKHPFGFFIPVYGGWSFTTLVFAVISIYS
jgi:hypothetical protein